MDLDAFLSEMGFRKEDIKVLNYEEQIKAVEQYGYALRYVHNQTEEICKLAVEQNGGALQYIDINIFEEK